MMAYRDTLGTVSMEFDRLRGTASRSCRSTSSMLHAIPHSSHSRTGHRAQLELVCCCLGVGLVSWRKSYGRAYAFLHEKSIYLGVCTLQE
ncbi:hypothetical protein IG631_13793 [Alternaria alternata]|nr:hypothetical protein IG631_13793 [Alternaria alternata]